MLKVILGHCSKVSGRVPNTGKQIYDPHTHTHPHTDTHTPWVTQEIIKNVIY